MPRPMPRWREKISNESEPFQRWQIDLLATTCHCFRVRVYFRARP